MIDAALAASHPPNLFVPAALARMMAGLETD
jgi:hypothetical protein